MGMVRQGFLAASFGAVTAPPIPKVAKTDVPAVTMEQMREVDRIMIEDLHIQLIQMMENAGRNLAWLAMERFSPRRALVLAGRPGRFAALQRFLDYVEKKDRVWLCRRLDIARHWIKHHPIE